MDILINHFASLSACKVEKTIIYTCTYNNYLIYLLIKNQIMHLFWVRYSSPLVKFTPKLVLSLYMTVKCPVRIRLRINFTIEGLIVTIERGNSQFEFNYRLAVLLDRL